MGTGRGMKDWEGVKIPPSFEFEQWDEAVFFSPDSL
jgi:hypothetical protein